MNNTVVKNVNGIILVRKLIFGLNNIRAHVGTLLTEAHTIWTTII